MVNAVVEGVLNIGVKFSCKVCNCNVEGTRCIGKMLMSQRLDKCSSCMTAKLLVSSGDHKLVVHAFMPIIKCIVQDETITELSNDDEVLSSLLSADSFTLLYTSVYRP